MLFTSGLFLFVYLPITVTIFFLIARSAGTRAASGWLAAMSLLFYGYWAPVFLALLLGSILFNFFAGLTIVRSLGTPRAKAVLTFAIIVDLLALAFFKYYNFFTDNVREIGIPLPILDVVLPIGISFFTFTQIAYLIDVYKGKVKDAHLVHYTLFVTYFPHLIAGPILHHAEMMPQFEDKKTYSINLTNFSIGAFFLLAGLAKKVLVADNISPIADRAFQAAAVGQVGFLHAWEGAIAYAMQIYFDFSGYSDMAVGVSLLLNIQLPYNFASPYRSTSIVEFWRRWHISLSRFLRDYLYIALGGNRKGNARRYLNLFLTMVLGGLWHGAAWTFVIWGTLHGSFLMLNHGWRWIAQKAGLAGKGGVPGMVVGWALTMLGVLIAWVFFRATSVHEAFAMLHAMAGAVPSVDLLAGRSQHWLLLAALVIFTVAIPNTQTVIMEKLKPVIDRRALTKPAVIVFGLGIWAVLVTWLALVAASRENAAFIYFNF
ncbi:MAG: MBOAT family protein [Sphingobium sp.]